MGLFDEYEVVKKHGKLRLQSKAPRLKKEAKRKAHRVSVLKERKAIRKHAKKTFRKAWRKLI